MRETLTIGLMSGTSLDGVDGVLAAFDEGEAGNPPFSGPGQAKTAPRGGYMRVIAHAYIPFPPALQAELLALNTPGANEIHRSKLAANELARLYAQVVDELLSQTQFARTEVCAIGAHGQTIRHRPLEFDGVGYTCQINNPALLAELTGIDVIADFRARDVAAGGQGAPLVPAFHQSAFGLPGQPVAVLNIGGIANLSLLGADGSVNGFDCGPGNVLMDAWAQAHTGQAFDADGRFAQDGMIFEPLLQDLLREPYFLAPPPKSTGRDLFNANWLHRHLAASHADGLHAQDVQATLAELTARTATQAARTALGPLVGREIQMLVCGGGALNSHLMRRLASHWREGPVRPTDDRGIPAMQVEASAFAWLAHRHLSGLPGNLPAVTGANGLRRLGALYPAR